MKSLSTKILAGLLFLAAIVSYCAGGLPNEPPPSTTAETCENKTGFVICIPDGFRL